jgi:23S rRNA pseudouridine1911/1915/1917 synthase
VQGRLVEFADVIDVLCSPTDLEVPPRPVLDELSLLHEDRWLLAVSKPSGMISQPGSKPSEELALDQLASLRLALRDGARGYLRLVHRLDRLTSGVALFARNPQAHAPLTRAWAEGSVERRYLAIVEGVPDESTTVLDRPIGRDPGHDWRFRVADSGRKAQTDVRLKAALDDDLAVLECRLRTGRTHQVRVHLADWGHPVLGDRLYGSRRAAMVGRPLLHAALLALPHPQDGARVTIEAPLPDDIAEYMT